MKKLNEYPTPITNSFVQKAKSGYPCYWRDYSKYLERKLAACRDTLACINSSQILPENLHSEIRKTLAATA